MMRSLFFGILFLSPFFLGAQKNIQLASRNGKGTQQITISNVNGLQTAGRLYAGKITEVRDSSFRFQLMAWRNIKSDSVVTIPFSEITKIYVCTKKNGCTQRVHKIIGRPMTRVVILTGLASAGFFGMGQPAIGAAFGGLTAGFAFIEYKVYRKQVFDLRKNWKLDKVM